MSRLVYQYMCDRCSSSYYGETDRYFKVKSEEHIRISPLAFRKDDSSKKSSIFDHLLIWNNTSFFDEFAYRHHKYNVEVKESMLIKPDRPVLNGNNGSVKLFLFDNN